MKDYTRRLQVAVMGRWYIALTIFIGVTAITTGNNSIYAIESLLLSGLILSGILSERVIKNIDVDIVRGPTLAKSTFLKGDQVIVKNLINRHIFCIEIGEWVNGLFIPVAWIAHLRPLQRLSIKSKRVYETRGVHRSIAIAIATRFPFGFARKIRFKNSIGDRIVWPSLDTSSTRGHKSEKESEVQEGDIRQMLPDDDFRSIVWTLSNKGLDPIVRTKQLESKSPEWTLDIRCKSGPEFEKMVSRAALPFYRTPDLQSGVLVVIHSKGKRTYRGKNQILNHLAIIQAEGREGQEI